jgi:hypothetical protein
MRLGPVFSAGTVFLPYDDEAAAVCRAVLTEELERVEVRVVGWRVVPTKPDACGEIACHDGGGATQKREWGATHPAIPQADEVREAGLLLPGQDRQRITPASAGRGLCMGLERNGFTSRPTRVIAIFWRGLKASRCAFDFQRWMAHVHLAEKSPARDTTLARGLLTRQGQQTAVP